MKEKEEHKESSEAMAYRVGGLLYVPALKGGMAEKLLESSLPALSSVAFCLEDSIREESLHEAETVLHGTLTAIGRRLPGVSRPLIFVRIRSPIHLEQIMEKFSDVTDAVDGYILPKFDLSNARGYVSLLEQQKRLRIMPILETVMTSDALCRRETLGELKGMLDDFRENVLNIRVGANDLCNLYGLRRPIDRTIYDIGPVRDALLDMVSVFGRDYVVSGPVWNYFHDEGGKSWSEGLCRELEQDLLNGFLGKTAIHPLQLPYIRRSLQVSRTDYEDALQLAEWKDKALGVAKSRSGARMNELNCHGRWAQRILTLGRIYGIREE